MGLFQQWFEVKTTVGRGENKALQDSAEAPSAQKRGFWNERMSKGNAGGKETF